MIEISRNDLYLSASLVLFHWNECHPYPIEYELLKTALKEKQARENPKPLTVEQVKKRADKPYWHKSLIQKHEGWAILGEHIAKNPNDYHYGERWLAYDYEVKEE